MARLYSASASAHCQQTRTCNKFSLVATDVVNARVYEGIHFRFSDAEARKQGRDAAQWAFAHFLRPIDEDDQDEDTE